MAVDERLASRIRAALAGQAGIIEKRMFGGIAFLLDGNMCCGVHGDRMIVRLPPAKTATALAQAHTRVFDLTGRPMKGWILVEPAGLAGRALKKWIEAGVQFAASLPAK